jgi:multidrug efflux pump subunit AcrA (membrane-fusion protein)
VAQLHREFELEVDTIKEQLTIDEERYRYSTNLLSAGFETKAKADADRLTWLRTEKSLQQATNNLWMFQQFDRIKLLTQYRSAVEEAEEELARVVKQSEAKMAQFNADLVTKEQTWALNKKKLERDIKNLDMTKLTAPTDGLVVYASPEGRFSSESMIEEGATVRYRQEIIKLPDTSAMKLMVKVHEAHVSKVRPGQPAYIVLDPVPDRRFMGAVSKVAVLPNNQDRWSNPNLKVYDTEILITDELPAGINPGVSASAEIIVTNLIDVITVPVQAVTTLRGKPVVYLAGANPKPVPVQVGLFNTRFIQIIEGVNEGDLVLLSPPVDPQGADIDGTILNEGEEVVTNQVTVARVQTPEAPSMGGFGGSPPENGDGGFAGGQARALSGGGPGGGFDREAFMKQWDKDGDGELSEEERSAMQQQFGGRTGGGAGAGGQRGGGFPNREEMMKQYDTDGDGELNETERNAMREAMGRGRGRTGQGEGGGRGPRPGADENSQ